MAKKKKKVPARSGKPVKKPGKGKKKRPEPVKPGKGSKKKPVVKGRKKTIPVKPVKKGKGKSKKVKAAAAEKKGKSTKVEYIKPSNRKLFFGRVKKLIWDNYRSDFDNYNQLIRNQLDEQGKRISFTSIAGQVYNQCKNFDCPDEEILNIYRSISSEKTKEIPPEISPEYQSVEVKGGNTDYWNLLEDSFYDHLPPNVWIVSPLLLGKGVTFLGVMGASRAPEGKEFVKSDKMYPGKSELFRPFVDYMNMLQKMKRNTYGYAIYGNPYWNEQQRRWEVQIIPVDDKNNEYNYGFKPEIRDQEIPEEELPTFRPREEEKEKPEKPAPKPEKPSEDLEKIKAETERLKAETELEKEKQKTFEAKALAEKNEAVKIILEMMNKGVFTKAEAKEMLNALK